jgi:hypothetical protein
MLRRAVPDVGHWAQSTGDLVLHTRAEAFETVVEQRRRGKPKAFRGAGRAYIIGRPGTFRR